MNDIEQVPATISPPSTQTSSWVLGDTIEDVDKSAESLIFKRYRTATIFVFAILAIWEGFLGYLLITGAPMSQDDGRIIAMIAPFLIFTGAYLIIRNGIQETFMKQFAVANGLSYSQNGTPDNLQGALFNLGHSHSYKNLITGAWDNNGINLFNYSYKIGYGKEQTSYSCTIFEIQYPSPLPPILLIVDNQYFGGITPIFGGWAKIKPEGNFDKTFDLYGKQGLEIETLEIFSPDFMLKMLSDWPEFNLEFYDNELIVFYNKTITTKAELQKMYSLVQYLITKIEPVALRMKGSLEAMESLNAGS